MENAQTSWEKYVGEELNRYIIINCCETAEELSEAILKCSSGGIITGKTRPFDAEKMAKYVFRVIKENAPANLLTRSYGIRQQALYIKHCEQYKI